MTWRLTAAHLMAGVFWGILPNLKLMLAVRVLLGTPNLQLVSEVRVVVWNAPLP